MHQSFGVQCNPIDTIMSKLYLVRISYLGGFLRLKTFQRYYNIHVQDKFHFFSILLVAHANSAKELWMINYNYPNNFFSLLLAHHAQRIRMGCPINKRIHDANGVILMDPIMNSPF